MARSRRMVALQAELSSAIQREVSTVVLNIRNMLIEDPPEGTPIDTGFASNNWWFNIGAPANSPEQPTGSAAAGAARIASDTLTISNITINGEPLHLTNNAQYIGLLNDGSSTQTPAGFVERAILTEQFASRQRTLG